MDGVGNILTKKITFSDKYNLLIEDRLDLSTSTIGVINSFKTFYRDEKKSVDYGTSFSRDHLAFSTSEDVFNDESLRSVDSREDYMGHWVGHSQKHFVVAVYDGVNQQKISLYPKDINGMYRFGISEPMNFEGSSYISETRLYLGPKQKDVLEVVAPHFKYNLDLGFVYGIGEFFIVVLNFLYGLVNNWGVSIILLTVLFKVVLSPLQIMQLNSMVKMRKLSPKLQELQERYKNDRNKLSMEMMQLYKREKFNPAAGCLPLFAQFPIFIAMFWVTREAFEFRGESFLWIPDLAESDPYLIAPVLMGLMMFASQKLMPKPPQSQGMQAQIAQQMMVVFPPMITIVFLFMPAGVVVYSVVNMLLSIIPQVLIMSRAQSESG
jgi:YidC/Oxa1 family membrane protein insertase